MTEGKKSITETFEKSLISSVKGKISLNNSEGPF